MSEADFCGMDPGEFYAMEDFEARERTPSPEATADKRIRRQREEIKNLKNHSEKLKQSRDNFRQRYQISDAALSIAAKWLEQAGACTHYAGYTCDKDFTTPGVCAACIRRHMLKLAREAKEEAKPC